MAFEWFDNPITYTLAPIELDMAGDIEIHYGVLIDNEYIAVLDEDVLFLRRVQLKDDSEDLYEPVGGGLYLGRVKNKEVDVLDLVARVTDYMRCMTIYDFLTGDFRWDTDYEFEFVEAVS